MRIFHSIALFLVCFPLTAFSFEEQTFTQNIGKGRQKYDSLFNENGSYRLRKTIETTQNLPELIWEKTFQFPVDAEREFLEVTRKARLSGRTRLDQPPVVPPRTEVPGTTLWKVENQWSTEWENKYAQWVRENVGPDFFQRYKISTDCADIAFAFRWIFARNNALPAANKLPGSSSMFTHESLKQEWAKLPTDSEWSKDKRFLAALNYLMRMVYTHSLMDDSYPIKISKETFIEGTHHLSIYEHSGHTLFVSRGPSKRCPDPTSVSQFNHPTRSS